MQVAKPCPSILRSVRIRVFSCLWLISPYRHAAEMRQQDADDLVGDRDGPPITDFNANRTSQPTRRMSALRGRPEVSVGQRDFRF
jgi:hypothetical protein